MTNSTLVSYIDRSSGNYTKRTSYPTSVIIHCSGKVGDNATLSSIYGSNADKCCNYGIGVDGTIGLFIDEKYAARSTGVSSVDNRSISIMLMNSSTSSNMPVSKETYSSLIKLVVDICRRNFIQSLTVSSDPAKSTFLKHSWFAKTKCPGPYIDKKFSSILKEVNNELRTQTTAVSESAAKKAQNMIVVEATSPYLAYIDKSLESVSYTKLRLASVVGVMLYAGQYFTSNHSEDKSVISETLPKQVSQANKANMPFALNWISRAESLKEVDAEFGQLKGILMRYPPKLGIWITTDTKASKAKLTKLLNRYYELLSSIGLGSKSGLYLTRSQFSKIDWDNLSNTYVLWLVDRPKGLDNLDDLIVPEYFRI